MDTKTSLGRGVMPCPTSTLFALCMFLFYHLASPDWMKPATDGPQAATETARGSTALNEKYAGETSFVTWTFSLSVGNKEPARQRDET